MGLHNKFPPHFYKRGNLFNTYLGHTDGPSDAAPAKSSQKTSRSKRTVSRAPKSFPTTSLTGAPAGPAYELHQFALQNLTAADVQLFVDLVGPHLDPPPSVLPTDPYLAMREIVYSRLTDNEQRRYLTALESRLAAGEPLIRPKIESG